MAWMGSITVHLFSCRFVTEGGPSVDKLMPGDQIWQIGGEDVKTAPRDQVIQRVRSCQQQVTLLVCQPPLDNVSPGRVVLGQVCAREGREFEHHA